MNKRYSTLRGAARVRRFHTRAVIHQQTVGEHSFGVACLVLEIEPGASANLLRAALYHDAAEYILGDMPATAKWDYKALAETYGMYSRDIEEDLSLRVELTPYEQALLKFADMADLVAYAFEEWDMGNHGAIEFIKNGLEDLRLRNIPNSKAAEFLGWLENKFTELRP